LISALVLAEATLAGLGTRLEIAGLLKNLVDLTVTTTFLVLAHTVVIAPVAVSLVTVQTASDERAC
jgi:hypothetical protein